VNAATTERKTAEERREAVLDAALTEFSKYGFAGTSTDAIARAVSERIARFRAAGSFPRTMRELERGPG